jgi:hypothetical protein
MNTAQTEKLIRLAAHRIAFGVPAEEVATGLRAQGHDEEAIFLVIAAARILAG